LLKKNCLVSTKHSETKRQFTRYNTLQVWVWKLFQFLK
jgi:hypothetical protein